MVFFVNLPSFFWIPAAVWFDNFSNVPGHCNSFPKLYFIQHTFKNSKYQLFKTLRVHSRTTSFIFHQIVLAYCISLQMLMLMMIVVVTSIIIINNNYLTTIHYGFPFQQKIVSIGGFPVICTYQESPVLLTKKKKEKKYFLWANKFKSAIKCSSYTFFPRWTLQFVTGGLSLNIPVRCPRETGEMREVWEPIIISDGLVNLFSRAKR